jgi:malonate transporter
MLSMLTIVLPVFALIFAGWIARRTGMLGPQAATELNRFVVYLALPALLFDIVAHASWAQLWQPEFIAVFGLSCLIVFALTVAIRLRGARHLADAAIDGLNAGYANTGYIGFPLALVALGRDALAPATIATVITVCVLFAIAIVLIEAGLQSETSRSLMLLKVIKSLARNPLLIAPALGAAVPAAGVTIPASAETFLKLLGGAASPCALVALGLFLAQTREANNNNTGSTALLAGFKLLLQPLIAWALAAFVFQMPPLLTHTAVLLAALPTGTGPFMLAEFYRREAEVTSSVILVSTIVSLLSIPAFLYLSG